MSTQRSVARILVPALSALVLAGGAAAVASAETPVPPGSQGDVNGNGILDSSETPDNPDVDVPQVPELPAMDDVNGNGILDSSETPDNPDAVAPELPATDDVNGNGVLDSSETPDNPDD